MSKFARIALAAAAVLLTSQAFAADSGTLNVTATVSGICKINTIPAMAFTIDPSSTSPATASSTVQYKCTKGQAPTGVTVGGNAAGTGYSGTLTSPTTSTDMNFSISWTNPTSTGNGFGQSAQTFTLNGSIAVAQFADAEAGTDYTASTTVAILP
jgi:spore coat protein U-like protein